MSQDVHEIEHKTTVFGDGTKVHEPFKVEISDVKFCIYAECTDEAIKFSNYLQRLPEAELKKLTANTSEVEHPLTLTGSDVEINAPVTIKRKTGMFEIHLTKPLLPPLDTAELTEVLQALYQLNYAKLPRLFSEAEEAIADTFVNVAILKEEVVKEKEEELEPVQGKNNHLQSHERLYEVHEGIPIEKLFAPLPNERESYNSMTNCGSMLGHTDAPPKKLLLYGRAGIGKTVLCRYLVNQWAEKPESFEGVRQFQAVFWIQLRELVERLQDYKEDNIVIDRSMIIAEMVTMCCLQDSDWQKETKKQQLQVWLNENAENTLFILDGYDEVVEAASKGDLRVCLHAVLNQTQYKPYVILTSRPVTINNNYGAFNRKLECMGFTNENIDIFVKRYFNKEANGAKSASCLDFLKARSSIWGLSHIPINLELICWLWSTGELSPNDGQCLTMAALYNKIVKRVGQENAKKHPALRENWKYADNRQSETAVADLVEESLAYVGFHAMSQTGVLLKGAYIKKLLSAFIKEKDTSQEEGMAFEDKQRKLLQGCLHVGLLKSTQASGTCLFDHSYYFIHSSFQEFFSAYYVYKFFGNKNPTMYNKVCEFIRENKYKYYDSLVFKFISGLITFNNDKDLTMLFLQLIQELPREISGVKHICLLLNCLHEINDTAYVVSKNSEIFFYLKDYLPALLRFRELSNNKFLLNTMEDCSNIFVNKEIAEPILSALAYAERNIYAHDNLPTIANVLMNKSKKDIFKIIRGSLIELMVGVQPESDLLLSSVFPAENLDIIRLPITSNTAYMRYEECFYYIDKLNLERKRLELSKSNLEKLDEELSISTLKQDVVRRLTNHESNLIREITRYYPIDREVRKYATISLRKDSTLKNCLLHYLKKEKTSVDNKIAYLNFLGMQRLNDELTFNTVFHVMYTDSNPKVRAEAVYFFRVIDNYSNEILTALERVIENDREDIVRMAVKETLEYLEYSQMAKENMDEYDFDDDIASEEQIPTSEQWLTMPNFKFLDFRYHSGLFDTPTNDAVKEIKLNSNIFYVGESIYSEYKMRSLNDIKHSASALMQINEEEFEFLLNEKLYFAETYIAELIKAYFLTGSEIIGKIIARRAICYGTSIILLSSGIASYENEEFIPFPNSNEYINQKMKKLWDIFKLELARFNVPIAMYTKQKMDFQNENVVTEAQTTDTQDIANLAVRLFLSDDGMSNYPSHLAFSTWYHPDICQYLLGLSDNKATCIRVVLNDAEEGNNTEIFQYQLQQLVDLSKKLQRPALFLSKEPGAQNHFICGIIFQGRLLFMNPLGITDKDNCYQVLAKLKKEGILENIWLTSNRLQKHQFEEENLVSCGPIALELAMHFLTYFSPETLQEFFHSLQTNEPTLHEKSGLAYHGISINQFLPSNLASFHNVHGEACYRRSVCEIRKKHFELLKTVPKQQAFKKGVTEEDYLEECKNSPSQMVFNQLVLCSTGYTLDTIMQFQVYALLQQELGLVEHSNAIVENASVGIEDKDIYLVNKGAQQNQTNATSETIEKQRNDSIDISKSCQEASCIKASEDFKKTVTSFIAPRQKSKRFSFILRKEQEECDFCIQLANKNKLALNDKAIRDNLVALQNALEENLEQMELLDGEHYDMEFDADAGTLILTSSEKKTLDTIGAILEDAGQSYWNVSQPPSNSKIFFFNSSQEANIESSSIQVTDEITCGVQ